MTSYLIFASGRFPKLLKKTEEKEKAIESSKIDI
jgi:hypothetical protein